ncbi:MAG: DUF3293 domain-containing protein [Acidobacteria bacterium]|nr:DUF3293 domain-containing protein [Acidobacteriota bacterium]
MTAPHADALVAAYRRTEYRVEDRGYAFVLRVDEPSAALRVCHDEFAVRCSAYLTAWNPRSQPTARDVNRAAMQRLEADLHAQRLPYLQGIGVDPAGDWRAEPSLLVLGADQGTALVLAQRYAQHAILCTEADATPRLIFT